MINKLMLGKYNFVCGLIVAAFITAIAMGCNGGKTFDLSNSDKNGETNRSVSNTNSAPVNMSENSNLSATSNGKVALESNTNSTPVNTSEESKLSDKPDDVLAVPSEREMQDLVKTSLLDFNDGVQKKDFTDFYSKIANPFKKIATPEKLKTGFQEFIDKKIDISEIKDKTAKFDPQPSISKKYGYDVLSGKGRYDASPNAVKFLTEYIMEDGKWKLVRIEVDNKK